MTRFRCRVLLGDNMPNLDFMSDPDPYFKVECGSFKYISRTRDNRTTSIWDESFEFDWSDGQLFKLICFDKDFLVSDDYIGVAVIPKPNVPFMHGWHQLEKDARVFIILEKI